MKDFTKQQILEELVNREFLTPEQVKGFEKLTQEELSYLLEKSEDLNNKDEQRESLEKKLKELKKELATYKKGMSENVKTISEPGLKFEFRGDSYQFTGLAPQKIRYNNEILTQEELSKKEDFLLELIGGKSSLIKKI